MSSLPIEWPELADRLYTRAEAQAMMNEAYAEGRGDESTESEKMRRALGDIISQTIVTERMDYPDPQDWKEKSARVRQIARDALTSTA